MLREFTDSSDIRADGTALAARMAEDGYLFFHNLLPREEVAAVRRQFLDHAARGDMLARDSLLRIIQRDPDTAKRDRARQALQQLEASPA